MNNILLYYGFFSAMIAGAICLRRRAGLSWTPSIIFAIIAGPLLFLMMEGLISILFILGLKSGLLMWVPAGLLSTLSIGIPATCCTLAAILGWRRKNCGEAGPPNIA